MHLRELVAIQPHFVGQAKSVVYTLSGKMLREETPLQFIQHLCIAHWSTYEGRVRAAQRQLGYEHKVPILIAPPHYGAFPTMSPTHPECTYIFQYPFRIVRSHFTESIIRCMSGQRLTVNSSAWTLMHQQYRLYELLLKSDRHGECKIRSSGFPLAYRKRSANLERVKSMNDE